MPDALPGVPPVLSWINSSLSFDDYTWCM